MKQIWGVTEDQNVDQWVWSMTGDDSCQLYRAYLGTRFYYISSVGHIGHIEQAYPKSDVICVDTGIRMSCSNTLDEL